MYIRHGARITGLIWRDRLALCGLIALAVLTELIEAYIPRFEVFSIRYVAVLSAALSIFLVFRFNEAYERWWEARKLWGGVVNSSRDFARQVLSLLPSDAVQAHGRSLIYRQVAFVHALRIRLREGNSPEAQRQLEPILRRLLPEETEATLRRDNVPLALLQAQSGRIRDQLRTTTGDHVLLARFDATFSDLSDAQGGCERIKNTAFPDAVSLITRILVWGMAVLLYVATIGPRGGGVWPTVAVGLMAMGYIWIDTMGRDLNDPFENAPNDTAMTAISIGIEHDLREMLGETELPEPGEPNKGVLM